MSESRVWLPVLLLLLLPVGTAIAESSDDAESDPTQSDHVDYVEVRVPYAPQSNTIASKLPLQLQRTPSNIGVVTSALMREQNAGILSDALANISGINVQAGSGVFDYYLIRGFNSVDGGLVLTDGAIEPEATFYGTYNVEGVEVLKGPSGFLYGAQPLAGAVNLIRKQPLPGNFTVFDFGLGSFDTYDGTVDWNMASDDGSKSFRLNGMFEESDQYRNNKESQHFAANPSFSWKLSERTKLNFNAEFVDAEFSPDAGIPLVNNAIPNVSRRQAYESPFDFSDQQISRFQFDLESKISDRLRIRNKAYFRELDWDTAGTLIVGSAELPPGFGGTQAFRSLTELDDEQQFFGNQFEAILEFNTGRVKHNLLAGVEIAQLTDDFDFRVGDLPSIGVFDPVETATSPVTFPFLIGDGDTEVIAPYLIDQIEFPGIVQLLVGMRYDDIDTDVTFNANQQEAISGFQRDDSDVSPTLGITITPSDDLTFYANAGESFAPIGARVFNASVLDPEQSQQLELGTKIKFMDGKAQTTVSAYRIDRDNIPITDPNGLTQQAGDQRSEGLEFEFAAQPLPRLRTFFSYAYNETELVRFSERIQTGPNPQDFVVLDRSGNIAAFAPEHIANLWISRSFGNGLGVAGGLRFVSDQYIDEDNAFEIDSYTTLDGALFYDFKECRIKVNLKNITDEDYERRGFGPNSVIPADPFTASVGVELRL